MRRFLTCWSVMMSLALVGCGDSEDSSTPAQGGAGGQEVDSAAEATPEASSEAAPEVGTEASPEAALDGAAEGESPEADAAPTSCTEPPREFWIYDLSVMPPQYIQIPATCRGAGNHAYVYVADDLWPATMDQTVVDKLLSAFESSTPADPKRGLFEIAANTFGQPTDVDSNGHVFVLYYEIQGYQSHEFDGFIRREDMLGGTKSNKAEVLYLDGVRNDPAGEYMLGVAAHEFEHMILLNHNPQQAGWLDETMAEASMIACGYYGDLDTWVKGDYAKNPTQSLTTAPPEFNYGAGFLFGGYLLERFGPGFFTALAEQSATGIGALDATLTAQSKPDTFKTLLADWAAASFLDVPTLQDGRWGYKAFDVPTLASTPLTLPAAEATYSLVPYSAKYLLFTVSAASSTLKLTLKSDQSANLAFRSAIYPDTDKTNAQVGSFSLSSSQEVLSLSPVGGAMNRVVLAVVEIGGAAATVTVSAELQ